MRRIFLLIATLSCIFPVNTGWGQMPDLDTGDPTAPWHIMADRIYFDDPNQSYVAEGNVSIIREGRVLTADRVILDEKSRQAFAEGDVRLVAGQDQLYGRTLNLHLDNETGLLTDGTLFLAQNHLYISGREIEKTGPESYSIRQATLTSCDGPDPAWRITSREVKVTIEGYGTARHAAFWVRRVPLLYTPYLFFPVKVERQSGLLAPSFGYSERRGAEYLQPLYWAIDDSSDATFFTHYMDKRGLRGGLEYRYVRSAESYGAVMADGFTDRRVDDGTENSDQWGFSNDATPRPNTDRYWLRAKADQNLPADFKARLDLDIVSDQDYLREFRSGQNGFTYTQDYFREMLGRDIDDYDESIRFNRLNASRLWNYYTLNADLRWFDDVIKRRQGDIDDTLQQLPVITFDGIRQSLAGSPLYVGFASSYVNFYREEGERGQRVDLHPRIYYPFYVLKGISVEPSAGFRQTAWHIDRHSEPGEEQRDHYRAIYDLRLDLNTEFFQVFDFGRAGYDRIKHAIMPEVVYEYIPDNDQGDLPLFNRSVDRILRRNTITYGITNFLTARRPLPNDQERIEKFRYLDFFRLKAFQSFDINEYNEDQEEQDRGTQDGFEPFSDITAEMDITPGRYVSFTTRAEWSPYDSQLTRYRAGPRLWNDRGDFVNAYYIYRREMEFRNQAQSETLSLAGRLIISARWQVRGEYEYNFVTSELVTSVTGVGYRSQCWSVDVDYREESNDRGFMVLFTLAGLGTIGQ
jgi:LPS-assembly protein